MSEEQKSCTKSTDIGNILSEAGSLNGISWEDFWEKHDNIEEDLEDAKYDLRDAYETFD